MAGRPAAPGGDERARPVSCSPPTLGWLGRLGRAAGLPQPAQLVRGKGCGKGVWEGGRGEWQVCQAAQAPFPTAVCHWHGHSHGASLICSSCKSVGGALVAGAADELWAPHAHLVALLGAGVLQPAPGPGAISLASPWRF